MILLLPILRNLRGRYPDAELHVACEKRNCDVLHLAQLEHQPLIYDSNPFTFLSQLRRNHYDIAIDSEQFHHFSAVFGSFAGAAMRVGFKINPRRNGLYTHLVGYSPDGPEGEQFQRLLLPLGIHAPPYELEGILRDSDMPTDTKLDNQLAHMFRGRPFAAVHTGTSTRYKQWAPRRFEELLRQLEQRHGLGAVLVGANSDRTVSGLVETRVRKAGGTILSTVGQLNLQRSASLIRKAHIFIGVDSGLTHLSVAVGTPSIAIFGSSDCHKWGFENSTHAVVRKDLACAPCAMFGYHKPCKHFSCMEQIGVPDVMAACTQVLSSLSVYQPDLL